MKVHMRNGSKTSCGIDLKGGTHLYEYSLTVDRTKITCRRCAKSIESKKFYIEDKKPVPVPKEVREAIFKEAKAKFLKWLENNKGWQITDTLIRQAENSL
jgi:pyruvate carboxylase